MTIHYCTAADELSAFVEELSIESRIALDLEGESNLHRYGIHLCLVQIATGKGVYLIDPLPLGNSLSLLKPLFENPAVTKVMFSPDFDVRLMHHASGIAFKGIFDLQLAAKWSGFEKTGLTSVLTELGIKGSDLGKADQTSDWMKRPLSEGQLEYAAADVLYLLEAHDALAPRIQSSGKAEEFAMEMRKMEAVRFQEGIVSHGFRKKLVRFPRQLSELAEKLYWEREKIAKKLDLPPFKVMSNDSLIHLAKRRPATDAEWQSLKGINPRIRRDLGPIRSLLEDN